MTDDLFTVETAAARLGLHPKTVLRLIREGRLRATRIGKSYRIARADFEAFSGLPPAPAAPPVRATCIVELPDLAMAQAERLAATLTAAVVTREPRPVPIHLTTAYDPITRVLKVVLIAAPLDAATVLKTLDALAEAVQ